MGYKLEMLEEAARLERSGNWQEMLTFCKGWASDDPLNLFAWKAIGFALIKLGRPIEAIPMYRKAIEVAPAHPVDFMGRTLTAAPLWAGLGRAFSDLGDHQKAIEAFLEATKIDPGVADIWNDLGIVYINMTPRDTKSAFEAFRNAYNLDPKHTNCLKNMGFIQAMSGSEEGVKVFYKLLYDLDKCVADDFLLQAKESLADTKKYLADN